MKAIMISIGSELTSGRTVDTNSAWLSRRLGEIGVEVVAHVTVADEMPPIVAELRRAIGIADVVILSGGLGPTDDDLTRQALAEVLGVSLELRENCEKKLRAFFENLGRPMPQANLIQAHVPEGCEVIDNDWGTAPGIEARHERVRIFALPGVPGEMQRMYDASVHSELEKVSAGRVILGATLHCFGAGESDIAARLGELMARGRNPSIGTTAKDGIIGVRIYAAGADRKEAQTHIDKDIEEISNRLGRLIYGRDEQTLASVVNDLLKEKCKTLATVESCTGGLLAKNLTDVSGSSAVYLQGWITYANRAKINEIRVPAELIEQKGAVNEEVARAMAVNGREKARTDYAISVTGIAGPTGGTREKPVGLVFIGLADEAGCQVFKHTMGTHLSREQIRIRTVGHCLNHLRLRLLGQ